MTYQADIKHIIKDLETYMTIFDHSSSRSICGFITDAVIALELAVDHIDDLECDERDGEG